MAKHVEQLRNHWWWRPGWAIGRRFYTWHLTFDGEHELYELVRAYQRQLAQVPGLDLIPLQWLHLTMQGLGFTHDITPRDADRIVAAAALHLGQLRPTRLTFQCATVRPEAIALPPEPPTPVQAIRDAIRAGIGDVWGVSNVPEQADGFQPHLSLAYSNDDQPAAPIIDIIERVTNTPVTITIDRAALIVLNRDQHVYRWTTYATVPIGNSQPH
jgi:hypothetical protein